MRAGAGRDARATDRVAGLVTEVALDAETYQRQRTRLREQTAYFPDGVAWSRVPEPDHLGEYETVRFGSGGARRRP